MDEAIAKLQRAIKGGDSSQRRALLQALLRAGQPLGEAFPEADVRVDLRADAVDDTVLEVLGALDPERVVVTLGEFGEAELAGLADGRDLRVRWRDGAICLFARKWEDWERVPDWKRRGTLWRHDAPTPVRKLASNADGSWLLADRLARGVAAYRNGDVETAVWSRPGPAALAVGVLGDRAVVVIPKAILVLDLTTGRELERRPVEPAAKLAAVGQDTIVTLQGSRLFAEDGDGEPRWTASTKRKQKHASSASSLTIGPERVALCAGDVELLDLATGEACGRAARTIEEHTWVDPESTMGLGRDSGVVERPSPSFEQAAFQGTALLTRDAKLAFATWQVQARCAKRISEDRTLDRPLLATSPGGLAAAAFPGGRLSVWRASGKPVKVDLPRGACAIASCGERFVVGTQEGALVLLKRTTRL